MSADPAPALQAALAGGDRGPFNVIIDAVDADARPRQPRPPLGTKRLRLRLATRWPWATQITAAINRLQALAPG